MNTNTVRLLEKNAARLFSDLRRWDPEIREAEQQHAAHRQAFLQKHRRNRVLIRQVLELEDRQGTVDALQQEYYFRLGLQMGLELGALDLIPPQDF